MKRQPHAQAVGAIPPTSDEGPTVAAVAPQESKQDKSPDYRGAPHAGQALRVIVSMLYGAALRGFCRVLAKALGVQHG